MIWPTDSKFHLQASSQGCYTRTSEKAIDERKHFGDKARVLCSEEVICMSATHSMLRPSEYKFWAASDLCFGLDDAQHKMGLLSEPALRGPGSSLGSQTCYPNGGFSRFNSVLQDRSQNKPLRFIGGIEQDRALVSQPPRSDQGNRCEEMRQEMGRGGLSSRRSATSVSYIAIIQDLSSAH
jgi:hypothetical protein